MSTTPVTNPKTFTITDPAITAENVTGFQVLFGRTSGGPYTLTAQVPTADIDAAAGTVTGTIASLESNLAAGAWFAVAEAVNAGGTSANSPEAAFTIVPPAPSAPTGFTVA
jgi:hypothetical protein